MLSDYTANWLKSPTSHDDDVHLPRCNDDTPASATAGLHRATFGLPRNIRILQGCAKLSWLLARTKSFRGLQTLDCKIRSTIRRSAFPIDSPFHWPSSSSM